MNPDPGKVIDALVGVSALSALLATAARMQTAYGHQAKRLIAKPQQLQRILDDGQIWTDAGHNLNQVGTAIRDGQIAAVIADLERIVRCVERVTGPHALQDIRHVASSCCRVAVDAALSLDVDAHAVVVRQHAASDTNPTSIRGSLLRALVDRLPACSTDQLVTLMTDADVRIATAAATALAARS